MSYPIKPYDEVVVYKINRIQIVVSNLELDIKANISTVFYDNTGMVRRSEFAVLEGQEYMDWKTDDYIVKWVCKKYNLVLEH